MRFIVTQQYLIDFKPFYFFLNLIFTGFHNFLNKKIDNHMNQLQFIYIILRHSAGKKWILKKGRNCIERVVRKLSKMCM